MTCKLQNEKEDVEEWKMSVYFFQHIQIYFF